VCKKKKMKDTREARKKIGRNFGLHTPAWNTPKIIIVHIPARNAARNFEKVFLT
jgi:hypothetical protein